tara:strand:- start:5006 stop:8389 length:3384 start_codon:yes stop_codon:yes gene_type:complete
MSRKYIKKDPISHCLDRPDMYVGSTRLRNFDEFIAIESENLYKIILSNIVTSPAILRIFVEALSNTIDNVERSKNTSTPCSSIYVEIDRDSGKTSIWNDGDIVPIEINDTEGVYNHTMIFGQLLTGSNYNDEEERVVAGRNGLGIKLCNIFSSQFTVEGLDPINGKKFSQTWRNNMRDVESPIISSVKKGKGYTKVSWIPDFNHFGLSNYSEDIINLYIRHVIDASMLTNTKVYFNNKLIPVKNLSQYSQLYDCISEERLYIKTQDCECLITPSEKFQFVSFVNGVYTRLGGQHVDSWTESIFRPIIDKFNGKDKKSKSKSPKLNINDVRQFFRIFIVSTVIRPEFDGQDKNRLESPAITSNVKSSHINTILKWSNMENIENVIKTKEILALKKTEKGKKKYVKIEGLDSANNAGTKYSKDCTLFICEGLSAKTYVVAGIETGIYDKHGRDWFGVLPVTGKLLNVRNSTSSSIAANKVIVSIIQTLGLKYDCDYNDEDNFKSLSYGKVVIVSDADVDGIHIKGLIINLIHSLFPSLLDREDSYILAMETPIARVFIPKEKDLLFYDERRFKEYLEHNTKVKSKYYKGLGTTREEDVPDTFGNKMIEYKIDKQTNNNMNKVFNKKFTDERKKWLENYIPESYTYSLDDQPKISDMSISYFLDGEMIKFSHADCARSIPNGIDGLKESQRKILYAVRKRNLKFSGSSLKVAQLSGYTAEHSNYHHGEQNLQDTIINMAASFPGTNNIPLLYPDGGFGTRLEGGKDAASARYIYTKMEEMTEYIFRSEDDPILNYVNDDGDFVQPEFYIPIIPMILVNGCTAGIGTGWSCTIPCYNPLDIIECIKIWLKNDGEIFLIDPDDGSSLSLLPSLIPWYRSFKGNIEPSGEDRFVSKGVLNEKKNSKEIKELPIGLWTNKFKEYCEDLVIEKKIKHFKNYSTTNDVHFVIEESKDGLLCNLNNLKLESYLYTSNMVLFDSNNKLKKYTTIDKIINDFCHVRLQFYQKRKKYQISILEKDIKHLSNKQRFIQDVISENISFMKKSEEYIISCLEEKKYDKENDSYDYLLRLQVRTFTLEKVKQLDEEISLLHKKLSNLINKSEEDIWLNELEHFNDNYIKWLTEIETRKIKKRKN